jgi:hypothetical protein
MRPSLRHAAEVNRELERRLVEQTEGIAVARPYDTRSGKRLPMLVIRSGRRRRDPRQSGDGPTMVEDLDLTATAHHPQVPRQVSFNSDTDAASM